MDLLPDIRGGVVVTLRSLATATERSTPLRNSSMSVGLCLGAITREGDLGRSHSTLTIDNVLWE